MEFSKVSVGTGIVIVLVTVEINTLKMLPLMDSHNKVFVAKQMNYTISVYIKH